MVPAAPARHRRPRLAIGFARLHGLPLVLLLLALGEGELDLDAAVLEVEPRRGDGHPFAVDAALDVLDLASMEEELAACAWPRGRTRRP